ncbi:preprotein translocase subunit YajC [Agromyces terreus]|uniref:Preprotein translocase subunit YajC n=1 Tax=Agromyces terreus TaxID=424795 RepID=A0A9X2H7B9_9MICO|nr:preprotein translocase subunit YajC [Agromyces terreus]MCP2372107.1 preprotein translocase subunit YajC [Agromyces terreus]
MTLDPFTIIMLAVLAVLIFFMFRNSRKRQAEAQKLQSSVVPGAKVMTNSGVFGTILSIDEDENQVLLETTPGTVLTVHRQTVSRVVEPVAVEGDDDADAPSTLEGGPEFGERVEDAPIVEATADDATDLKKKSDD